MPRQIFHAWDKEFAEESDTYVFDVPKYFNRILKFGPLMAGHIKLNEKLMDLLEAEKVFPAATLAMIKGSPEARCSIIMLFTDLTRLKVHKLHAFCRALANARQYDVVELMGLDAAEYVDLDHILKSSNLRCPACMDIFSHPYLLIGCSHIVCRPCIKGAKYTMKDTKEMDVLCPVPECKKTSEAKPCDDNDMGLDAPEEFSKICEKVSMALKETCTFCKITLPYDISHACTDCNVNMCSSCIERHLKEKGTHTLEHQHPKSLCCLDRRPITAKFSKGYDLYLCKNCEKDTPLIKSMPFQKSAELPKIFDQESPNNTRRKQEPPLLEDHQNPRPVYPTDVSPLFERLLMLEHVKYAHQFDDENFFKNIRQGKEYIKKKSLQINGLVQTWEKENKDMLHKASVEAHQAVMFYKVLEDLLVIKSVVPSFDFDEYTLEPVLLPQSNDIMEKMHRAVDVSAILSPLSFVDTPRITLGEYIGYPENGVSMTVIYPNIHKLTSEWERTPPCLVGGVEAAIIVRKFTKKKKVPTATLR